MKNWAISIFLASALLLVACEKEPLQGTATRYNLGLDREVMHLLHAGGDTLLAAMGTIFVDSGGIYESIDAGQTWRASLHTNLAVSRLTRTSSGQIYGSSLGNEYYLRDSFAAAWQTRTLLGWDSWRSLAWSADGRGIIVGGLNFSYGFLQRIEADGSQPTRDSLPHEFYDVAWVGGERVVACGYGLVLWSDDGAQTWEAARIRGDFFQSLHFPTEQIGYLVGKYGSIWRSEDGGKTWKRLRRASTLGNKDNRYSAVFFRTADEGWISGENGTFLHTTDGGENWQRIDLGTDSEHFRTLCADGRYVWLGTERGEVWRVEQ